MMWRGAVGGLALALMLGVGACTTHGGIARNGSTVAAGDLQSLPQTINLEQQDRIARFHRLADIIGITPPEVDELQLPAGQVPSFDYPIPVVRVVFDERVFFDFGKDVVRPDAQEVLDMMAENMKRDVPDARLLVLGHTDAIGSDAYNIDLSRRRAFNVMMELIDRGVQPTQISLVPIGKSQPIAPNSTEEGRARNRRVEFMISASQEANLQLIHLRRIIRDYLWVNPKPDALPDELPPADVLAPLPNPKTGSVELRKVGEVAMQKPEALHLNKPDEETIHHLNKPEDIHLNELNEEFRM